MTLSFFASITAAPSDIRKIERLVNEAQPTSDPLAQILTTPLFLSQAATDLIRRLKDERGSQICFDSAGYYVQVGKNCLSRFVYASFELLQGEQVGRPLRFARLCTDFV